jgi:hypothetical protein
VTEGELKANSAFERTQIPTVSLPGVGAYRQVFEVLKAMGANTVRLAFDMDAREKPVVANALRNAAKELKLLGYEVEIEQWPAEHKGIDDALAADAKIDVLRLSGRPPVWRTGYLAENLEVFHSRPARIRHPGRTERAPACPSVPQTAADAGTGRSVDRVRRRSL